MTIDTPAADPLEALAPAYDTLTAAYDHERWIATILAVAAEHDLAGGRRRALDVACGTGASFLPLLDRGWDVTGCDISPGMLDVARRRAPAAELLCADMRTLPALGEHDLVLCLCDVVNCLLDPGEMVDALAGMRRNLAPGGLMVFDSLTLEGMRMFAQPRSASSDRHVIVWHGEPGREPEVEESATTQVDVFTRAGDVYRHGRSTVTERHYTQGAIVEALAAAELQPVTIRGQQPGVRLSADVDERRDHKMLVFATHA